MPIMKPDVNNNGDTRQTLVDTRVDLMAALALAVKAHKATLPHGRNYLGVAASNTQYWIDRDIWQQRHDALQAMYKDVYEEALAIKNGDK